MNQFFTHYNGGPLDGLAGVVKTMYRLPPTTIKREAKGQRHTYKRRGPMYGKNDSYIYEYVGLCNTLSPPETTMNIDPNKRYVIAAFTESQNRGDHKHYTIEVDDCVTQETFAPEELLIVEAAGAFAMVKVLTPDPAAYSHYQATKNYRVVGTVNLDAWRSAQQRKDDEAAAHAILEDARSRFVKAMDFSKLAPLMTVQERHFVAKTLDLSLPLDTAGPATAD